MLKASTALVLTFSLGSLIGCTAGVPATTVQAANQPPIQQHSVNRYELHGSPDKVALLVDSETGSVWQYADTPDHKKEFVPIPVIGKPEQVKIDPADPLGILPPAGAKVRDYTDLK